MTDLGVVFLRVILGFLVKEVASGCRDAQNGKRVGVFEVSHAREVDLGVLGSLVHDGLLGRFDDQLVCGLLIGNFTSVAFMVLKHLLNVLNLRVNGVSGFHLNFRRRVFRKVSALSFELAFIRLF